MKRVVLNNKVVNLEEEILSLGLYSYGVFTTFLVRSQKTLMFNEHVLRLQNDVEKLFGVKLSKKNISQNLKTFLDGSKTKDQIVRVSIFPKDFMYDEPEEINELSILISSKDFVENKSLDKKTISLVMVQAKRIYPSIKNTNFLIQLQARAKARQKQFDDALMVEKITLDKRQYNLDIKSTKINLEKDKKLRDKLLKNIKINNKVKYKILEGPTWSIFFVKDNTIYTPKVGKDILPGITRKALIEKCCQGFKVKEMDIYQSDLKDFDSCFVTNCVFGLKPVKSINSIKFNVENQIISTLFERYKKLPYQKIS